MEMGSGNRVGKIEPEGEIYVCPSCSYTDGFHVSFKVKSATTVADIYLICPNCHSRFTVNWQVNLEKF